MKHWTLTLAAALCFVLAARAQEHAHADRSFPHFRVAALIGHTYVPTAAREAHFFIPSWGLDLEYWFNETWAVGLHNDIEFHTFLIETVHEELLERHYPVVLTLDAIFKPWEGLVFQFGPGYEIEKNEGFFLFRLGVEYEIEFGHHWDIAPMLFYDSRFEANDTWSIALGLGKRF